MNNDSYNCKLNNCKIYREVVTLTTLKGKKYIKAIKYLAQYFIISQNLNDIIKSL